MHDQLGAKRAFWLLALLCAATLLPFLGETLFNTRGEPREAVVAMSMLHNGNWILPVNNGVDLAYKPPFFHWLVALCSLPVGEVTEYTSRLPSALAMTAMTLGIFCFYRKRCGLKVAAFTAVILLTNFEVHRAAVACRVDMVLTCMMVLALLLLYRWMEGGMKAMPWLAVLCLSGAFLTKGPVGAALPCLVAATFGWLRGLGFWRVLWRMAVVGALSLLLPAAWYVAAYRQGGEKFLNLVYEENVLRLLGRMSYDSHVNPWPYNVMTVVTGLLPYTVLVLLSLFVVKWRRKAGCLHRSVGGWRTALRRKVRTTDGVRLYSFLSIAIIFVFYCIPKSKRSVYLLPIYPFLAYYLARLILWLAGEHRKVLRGFGWFVASLGAVLTLAFFAIRLGWVPESIMGSGKHAAENVDMLRALRDTRLGVGGWIVVLLPLAGFLLYCRRGKVRTASCAMSCVVLIFVALDGVIQPLVLNTKSDYRIARYIEDIVPQGRVFSFRSDVTPGNPLHPFTINFYLGDRVVPFEAFMPMSGTLIVGDDDIEVFKHRFPNYQVMEGVDFHRRSCDDHKMLKLYTFKIH